MMLLHDPKSKRRVENQHKFAEIKHTKNMWVHLKNTKQTWNSSRRCFNEALCFPQIRDAVSLCEWAAAAATS